MGEARKLIQVGPVSEDRLAAGARLFELDEEALYPRLQAGAGSQV